MRRRSACLACLSAGALWSGASAPAAASERATAAQPGDPVNWPRLKLLDGGTFGPDDARAHAVVVVWWSLHCPFCVRHNARLTQLQSKIGSLPLRIITAVREPDAAAVRAHLQRHGHRFPVTLDIHALSAAISSRRVSPLTATVDRQGRLRQVIPGEMAEDDMLELLQLAQGSDNRT